MAAVEARFDEINKLITENIDDYQKVAELSKEKSDMEEIVVNKAKAIPPDTERNIEEAESLLDSEDEDMRNLAQEDLDKLQPQAEKLEARTEKPAGSERSRAINAM